MKTNLFFPGLLMLGALIVSCQKENVVLERQPDTTYNPVILPANFINSCILSNTYFQFGKGKKYIYEGQTEDGLERIEIELLSRTKVVNGILTAVVRDRAFLDGKLLEDTDDWFAQDNTGRVWYMGEFVKNYNPDGTLKDNAGSWEAGVDGAKAGFQMLADPKPGDAYRQEYAFNIAEDEAEVVETGLTVTVPFGTFTNCIKIREFTALEPDAEEYKIYAPGIGLIKEINVTDDEEIVLIAIQ